MIDNAKFYIGPMSKNIVDAITEYVKETGNKIGLIPSRRQVEHDGGYVNNWTTEKFSLYTENKLVLKRDHAGPGQGLHDDDGYKSLEEDCKFFNLIHIDPWKKYPAYKDGLAWTIDMINFSYNLNSSIEYEVGTEESIRRFESIELNTLLEDLKLNLAPEVFNKIKYLVIQSGTSLKGNSNTGEYDKERLTDMVKVGKKWDLLTKEHNGDYIPSLLIKEKMALGLDSINIAPEFGLIETISYINNNIDIEKFWDICYRSKRWHKWVDSNFNPFKNKIELIKICGHYVLSDPEFIMIKPDIDSIIKKNIKAKLNELFK